MTLKYQYTPDHNAIHLRHLLSTSEYYEGRKLRSQWLLPSFLLTITLWHTLFNQNQDWDFFRLLVPLAILIPAIIYILIHPLYWKAKTKKEIQQITQLPVSQLSYGDITIQLDNTHLHYEGPLGTSSTLWKGIESAELIPGYLIIQRLGGLAYPPIPIAQIGKETAQQAHSYIQSHLAEPNTPDPEPDPENDSLY